MSEILLQYTRAGKVESVHRGDVVVVDVKGKIVDAVGDPQKRMFWRSAAKPFQALPFVGAGGMDAFQITEEELALLVSSHSGEDMHVRLAEGILQKIGLDAGALDCGAAKPMNGRAARVLTENHLRPQALHNPCSGKHSGMLALCRLLEIPIEGYTLPEHAVQKRMHQAVADSARVPAEELEIGIDGCGVPVFYLPLYNMSLAYARLAQPENGDWGEREVAVRRIRDAMRAHPLVLSGTGRIDAAVAEATQGRIIAKIGAEAVYCLASVDDGIGITFKIEDGGYRAINPTVIAVLRRLDLLSKVEYDFLAAKYPPVLKNHRGDMIGTVETVF